MGTVKVVAEKETPSSRRRIDPRKIDIRVAAREQDVERIQSSEHDNVVADVVVFDRRIIHCDHPGIGIGHAIVTDVNVAVVDDQRVLARAAIEANATAWDRVPAA